MMVFQGGPQGLEAPEKDRPAWVLDSSLLDEDLTTERSSLSVGISSSLHDVLVLPRAMTAAPDPGSDWRSTSPTKGTSRLLALKKRQQVLGLTTAFKTPRVGLQTHVTCTPCRKCGGHQAHQDLADGHPQHYPQSGTAPPPCLLRTLPLQTPTQELGLMHPFRHTPRGLPKAGCSHAKIPTRP